MGSRRGSRVNELIREELSDIIRRQLKDPRLAVVTSITEVETSPDLRNAKVYISVLGDEEEREETMRALRAAASFMRRELKRRLTMKNVPYMTFHRDDSIEGGLRLSALIDEVVGTSPPADGPRDTSGRPSAG